MSISVTETALDAELGRVIEQISAECEAATSRSFTKTGFANQAYYGGRSTIVLKGYPVDTAATFQLKQTDPAGNVSIYDPADYVLDAETGIVRLLGGLVFPSGPNGALVTYTGPNYDPITTTAADTKVDVPSDLSGSVADLTKAKCEKNKGS